jgi:predicted DNA-binding transcriptional regulator YafY
MRADRLLSLLMLLQTRGQTTAKVLAKKLEVSERTIYRDVNALSAAGVPVYGIAGPEGGYALLDSYRTNLTGLNESEVRALFMLSIPEALTQLGVGQELKAALLKLSAALPDARRRDEERVRLRFHLDPAPWEQDEEPPPHLKTIHQAVWQDRKLYLTHHLFFAGVEVTHLVEPYGLVAKAGVWYLVCFRDGMRVHRVSHLLDARMADESFERPADFDLAAFWEESCAKRKESHASYIVTVRVAPDFVSRLPRHFGDSIRARTAQVGPPDDEGWTTLEIPFPSLEAARERLLGFGGVIEVLEPEALRVSIWDFATQTVALYER